MNNQQNPNNIFTPPHFAAPGGPEPNKGKGIASMVCGIVSLAMPIPFFGLAAAIAGLILAQASAKEGYVGGMRTAGLVCSIIGLVFGLLMASMLFLVTCAMLLF